MDYEQMSVAELREECQNRGLGTARSRVELLQRLADHDATLTDKAAPEAPAEPAPADETCPSTQHETVSAGPYRHTFPASPDGPDEEEHLAYRQTTVQAAIDAGCTPRGDAYRVGTVDGREVYEVNVRRVT